MEAKAFDLVFCTDTVRDLSQAIDHFQQILGHPCRCGHCEDSGKSGTVPDCPQRAIVFQMVALIKNSGLVEKYLFRFLWLALNRQLEGELINLLMQEMRHRVLDPKDLDRLLQVVVSIQSSHKAAFGRKHTGRSCGYCRDDT